MSSEVRIAVGLALWGVPLGIAVLVPGASGVLIYLLIVSGVGIVLLGQGLLARTRNPRVTKQEQAIGDIRAKNVSVNQSGGVTGDVRE